MYVEGKRQIRRTSERNGEGRSKKLCLLTELKHVHYHHPFSASASSSSFSDIYVLCLLLELQPHLCVYFCRNLCDYVFYISPTPVSKSLSLWACLFVYNFRLNV